jgi:hypothetical protein
MQVWISTHPLYSDPRAPEWVTPEGGPAPQRVHHVAVTERFGVPPVPGVRIARMDETHDGMSRAVKIYWVVGDDEDEAA